jgi:hypothetical protein
MPGIGSARRPWINAIGSNTKLRRASSKGTQMIAGFAEVLSPNPPSSKRSPHRRIRQRGSYCGNVGPPPILSRRSLPSPSRQRTGDPLELRGWCAAHYRARLSDVPPETRYARSGDISIAYQVTGIGPFDLVFVPPFITHVELWWSLESFAPSLHRCASFSRLILFDKRGTGMSDRVSGVPPLETRMDDLRALWGVLPRSEPAPAWLSAAALGAGVGPICTYELCATVSEASALGMITVAATVPEALEARLDHVRSLTSKPIGANFLIPVTVTDCLRLAIRGGTLS